MSEILHITAEQFTKRLVHLCLRGLLNIPKDLTDQHILLKSAAMSIGTAGPLTEKELNDPLKAWLDMVNAAPEIDRVSLRRWMVDMGYLSRDSVGSRYEVRPCGVNLAKFDPAIEQFSTAEILQSAREEVERRKQAYLQKAKGA